MLSRLARISVRRSYKRSRVYIATCSATDPSSNAMQTGKRVIATSTQARCFSMLSDFTAVREWHHPTFLSVADLEEKEEWLRVLLQSNVVDVEAFLVAMRTLATCKRPDAPLRAERWMARMEQKGLLASAECYRCVIASWANADKEDPGLVVTRAERWLTKLLDSDTAPTTECFNAFLDACTKGRALKGSNRRDLVREHAIKAESVLKYMIEHRSATLAPTTESFNYVIRGWTRCRRSMDIAERAMDILRLLERHNAADKSVGPNARSYAMVMDSLAVRAKLKVKRIRSRPHLWEDATENGLNEIGLLDDVLAYMREMAVNDPPLAPNTHALNIKISAWSHLSVIHDRGPSEAEKILQRMIANKDKGIKETAPDSYSYLMVMRAWVNSSQTIRGQRVAWWLGKQWKDFQFEGTASLQPTTASYNLVVRAWADLGEPRKAEDVLSELLRLSSEAPSLQPNSETFASVIRAWLAVADQGSRVALDTAVRWLNALTEREQRDEQVVTPVELYSGILASARKCASQCPEVLDVAVETFDKLRESHHVLDCLHYSRLLQVGLLALSRPQNNEVRTAFIQQVVHDCCEDGLISSPLIKGLANGPVFYDGWTIEESSRMVDELFPHWPLPTSWTRNVKQKGNLPERCDMTRRMYRTSHHGIDPYK